MSILDIIKSSADKDLSAFNEIKFKIGAELSLFIVILMVAAFCVFVYLSFKSTKDLKSKLRRGFLVAFRIIALTFILFIVFQPKLELRETKDIKSSMAVLFDDSLSMSLKKNNNVVSRQESLQKFIKKNNDYFEKLNDNFNVDYYTFGSSLNETELEDLLKKSKSEQPNTRIGESIEELKKINPAVEYKEAVIFTDGSDNGKISSLAYNIETELDKELLTKYVKSLGLRIHPVVCEGEDEDFIDLSIEKVVADKFGFIRTPFEIEVHISAKGLDKMNVPISLKEGNNIIKTTNFMIKEGENSYKIKMKFYPQKIGRKVYTVSLPTFSQELIQENNKKSFFVNIIRDKTRVLFVVGTPTWDERFLRRTLKNDPNIDLISFMILRTAYDYLNVPEKEMSLIPFPTREIFEKELHTFDVVIFCNFDYAPYTSGRYLNNIRQYVIRDGGAFLMIGGDRSFASGRYYGSPIRDILPIELSRAMTPFKFGKFKPVLTAAGNNHPILRLDYDEEKNKQLYESLPALEGINTVLKLKDDAISLMNHPKEKNEHGPAPVIAISEAGKGRCMAIMTDTLWRWNFPYTGEGGSPRIYENFWHNTLKWLIKDPELDLVKLSLTDTSFSVGEVINVKLKVLNHKYQPTERAIIKASVTGSDRKSKKLIFKKTEILGEYISQFTPEKEGNYVIEASASVNDKYLGKDIHPLIVEDAKDEYLNLQVNYKLLEELAKISGTEVAKVSGSDIKGKLKLDTAKEKQLLGKVEITFWDSKLNFVIIIIFLTLEWFIRRRYGLY